MGKKKESQTGVMADTAISDIKVSINTAQYIMLVKDIDALWGKICDCLDNQYPSYSEDIFKQDFEEILLGLKSSVMRRIEQSVSENLGTKDNYSII